MSFIAGNEARTQGKTNGVSDVNYVLTQIINVSKEQMSFYALCSYIVSITQ
jgi:hypothetical protein